MIAMLKHIGQNGKMSQNVPKVVERVFKIRNDIARLELNESIIGIVALKTIRESLTAIPRDAVSSHKASNAIKVDLKTNVCFQHIGHKIHPTPAICIEILASRAGHCHVETPSL